MGLEWHNRRRRNGKFVTDWDLAINPPKMDQLHIRAPFDLTQRIRKAAISDRQELTEWVLDACRERLRAEGLAANRTR